MADEFDAFRKKDLSEVNAALKQRGLPEIVLPDRAPVAWTPGAMEDVKLGAW